jgi:hypothetical protein
VDISDGDVVLSAFLLLVISVLDGAYAVVGHSFSDFVALASM